MDFIPADESPLFMKGFRLYVRWLFKRRFSAVWLKQDYSPDDEAQTIYYLNHHSWWDGLIPFLLNEYRFHQQARALMEDKQMKEHPFFSKIGAFSINREKRRQVVTSLRYAVDSFDRPNASLFIYPEGKITPPGSRMTFEGGLAWLSCQLPQVDIVPIGIYMHTIRCDKPELHLHVGQPVATTNHESKEKLNKEFEQRLTRMLSNLKTIAGFDDSEFEHFL